MKSIFFPKNHTLIVVKKLAPDHFLKNQNWVLWVSSLKFYSLFFLYNQIVDYENILKLSCWSLVFTYIKLFKNIKRSLELVSLHHFLHNFWRKKFLKLNSINWPNFMADCLYFQIEILGNICIAIICVSLYDVINFEISLNFLDNHFCLMNKKIRKKL